MYSRIWCNWSGAGGSSFRKISRSRTAPSGLENDSRRRPASAAMISALPPPISMIRTRLAGLRPVALDAQVNQARFFAAGDDLDRRAGGFRRARQKILLVAGVADGAGGHRADAHHVQLAVDAGHAGQHGASGSQGFFADRAGAENALTQARDFAFRGEHAGRLSRHDLGGLHADGVAADVDGGVAGHTSMLKHCGAGLRRAYNRVRSSKSMPCMRMACSSPCSRWIWPRMSVSS